MGVDLFSLKNAQDTWFNWSAWRFLLDTAKRFGWEPMGTVINLEEPPFPWEEEGLTDIEKQRIKKGVEKQNKDWDGTYYSNEDQIVTDLDSSKLLQAMTRAINKRKFLISIDEDSVSVIKEFMDFLKHGAFRIS
jgi:hypothetical protein